jgi:hypothetical protein
MYTAICNKDILLKYSCVLMLYIRIYIYIYIYNVNVYVYQILLLLFCILALSEEFSKCLTLLIFISELQVTLGQK